MSADGGVARPVRLPKAASLVAGMTQAAWLSADGEIELLPLAEAARRARAAPPFVCHARATARRLGVTPFPSFDLLELYAFVRPARFCVPTPRGLAAALDLDAPDGADLAGAAAALRDGAQALLGELQLVPGDGEARAIGESMAKAGWIWAEAALAALAPAGDDSKPAGLAVWNRLGEWAEHAPEPPPGNFPVSEDEARLRLAELVGERAEPRPQQADYAGACAYVFAPRDSAEAPRVLLAEAGTGVGKTLAYIAPASVWAEKNTGAVWISTYTRNLQHQIAAELDRLYPDPAVKARRVVVRKGRENYLCLLNFEDSLGGLAMRPQDAAAAGLVARWISATRDGDMAGGDLPGWLPELVGRAQTLALTDRRGECVHSACSHYHRCFIEKSVRRARRARIVVANHALVMIQAALGGLDDDNLPRRYVFDEGHHVFDAADGAFSLALTGREAAELRRWILGAEDGRRTRARGLKRRLDDLLTNDAGGQQALDQAIDGARNVLPGDGWLKRVADGRTQRAGERFLALVRNQVLARAGDADQGYSLETEPRPPIPGLIETARELATALRRIEDPLKLLAQRLRARLADDATKLDSAVRLRIEAAVRGLERRSMLELGGWRRMLEELDRDPSADFVDWLAVERVDGHPVDIGMHRHFVDPTRPFAEFVVAPAHGVLVTSATLTDGSGDAEADWLGAEARTGARHLKTPALRARVKSPFDYPAQTRVFIVNDIDRNDVDQIAAAYRELIMASGGGALGLFTAIQRLRAVHKRIAAPLEAAGLPLLAQHVDAMDTATLVDIFRAEEDSSLLGTDAVRDGVDVPGRSLRLIVFDRVPWPRPDILHRARKAQFGGAAYDDAITRLRLKQAFGRLVRRAADHGVFVLLDRAMPSRLLGAFPEGVTIERIGLKDTIAAAAEFLKTAAQMQ
ncbi:MAG: ATP-dependent DNA helicase [Alphaproteobacteria bacterium]|nr:ATP-dependent DNA helicase [Alphaproteobacteria bacterium]